MAMTEPEHGGLGLDGDVTVGIEFSHSSASKGVSALYRDFPRGESVCGLYLSNSRKMSAADHKLVAPLLIAFAEQRFREAKGFRFRGASGHSIGQSASRAGELRRRQLAVDALSPPVGDGVSGSIKALVRDGLVDLEMPVDDGRRPERSGATNGAEDNRARRDTDVPLAFKIVPVMGGSLALVGAVAVALAVVEGRFELLLPGFLAATLFGSMAAVAAIARSRMKRHIARG